MQRARTRAKPGPSPKERGDMIANATSTRAALFEEDHVSLCEALDRVLNKGVVLAGGIVISVADIDLIYVDLRALLASVETAMNMGALMTPLDDRRTESTT